MNEASVCASSTYEVRRLALPLHRRALNLALALATASFADGISPAWLHRGEIVDRATGETRRALANVNDLDHDFVREAESDLDKLSLDEFERKWLNSPDRTA